MLIKIVIALILLVILISLVSALFHLMRGKNSGVKLAKALTIRISLSLLLLLLIIISLAAGWIVPHGILPAPVNGG